MPENVRYARQVLATEAKAIRSLMGRIGHGFDSAVKLVLSCKGRVVVTGMGKPGIVGQKIAATLASTGTPSLFLHPAEALHGDLGKVTADDIVLALSNSGETEEIVRLMPSLKDIGAKIIALTATAKSTLGRFSDIVLEMGKIGEACPLGLAPSASTTALLALGDALALCVLKNRSFGKEEFAFFHPGGELGRKLLKVREVMRTGKRNPSMKEDSSVKEGLLAITAARAGAVGVVDRRGQLTGIFTDGDLRRHLETDPDVVNAKLRDVMTKTPSTIGPDSLASEALRLLRERKIDELPVVDRRGRLVGMLDVQDLLEVHVVESSS
jgi:arabinose-5-phosphate isomerase